MRNAKKEEQCKRHPRHRQSPGVCSMCLGEKLSSLSTLHHMDSSSCSSASSSSLSSYYSSSASSCSSPAPEEDRPSKPSSSSMSFLFSGIRKKKTKLNKSRSMDLVAKIRINNNDGFWSKLLRVQSRSSAKTRGHGEGLVIIRDVVVTS